MTKSICIIGAGIGGLTAGAYLAKAGYDVTVLEKATTVGGSAGWYIRKGRMFPTGATIAFGLEEKGVLRKILNDLQIKLPVNDMLHPMDVILPSGKVSIYKSKESWEKELNQAFSDRSGDVIKFWDELTQISQDVLGVTESEVSLPIRRLYDLGNLPKYLVQHPNSALRLARFARWTVRDLLKRHNLELYEPLIHFLNAQLIDAVQTDVSEAALLPSSVALSIYRKGSFTFENGMGQLCKALSDKIEELGGKVLVASPVQKVNYDEIQKKWSVESRKYTSAFNIVINNSGISFGPNTSYTDDGEFSWGAFRLDAIVSDEIKQALPKDSKLPFAYQIVPNSSQSTLINRAHGPVYVTFHKAKDKDGEPIDNEVAMTISVHTDLRIWNGYSKEDYKIAKEQLVSEILNEVEQVIPVKERLKYHEAGSPLTYEKFIGKSGVGGFPLTVKNAISKPRGVRSTLPQFYIVGEHVFPGPGTLSSCLSGYNAARAIMKE
ncbi:FAD-dependent oxidoreductase [Cytobacillus suaedae]|nr:FAD-dependent oxidoreductase [Cytobacillus suaedae]